MFTLTIGALFSEGNLEAYAKRYYVSISKESDVFTYTEQVLDSLAFIAGREEDLEFIAERWLVYRSDEHSAHGEGRRP